jgi:hypothetical protein
MDMHREILIQVPAHAAWDVIGERFGEIAEWAAPITASSLAGAPGVGAVRTCHIAGFGPVKPGVIRERLVAFDAQAMSFAYEAVSGMPAFIANAVNRWLVHHRSDTACVVSTHATIELRGAARLIGWLLRFQMERGGAQVLEELRHMVEHGRAHPRKIATARPAIAGAR